MAFTTKSHPGVSQEPPAHADGFAFNQSMLRVKDQKIALDFYTRVMGLPVLRKLDFADRKFSLYYLQMGWSTKSAPSLANKITAATGASA